MAIYSVANTESPQTGHPTLSEQGTKIHPPPHCHPLGMQRAQAREHTGVVRGFGEQARQPLHCPSCVPQLVTQVPCLPHCLSMPGVACSRCCMSTSARSRRPSARQASPALYRACRHVPSSCKASSYSCLPDKGWRDVDSNAKQDVLSAVRREVEVICSDINISHMHGSSA